MVVVLFPGARDEPAFESAGLEELAKLGVTSVAFVRDAWTAGLVLEGWAFNPRDTHRAVGAVIGAQEGVRTLQPLMQMGVSSAPSAGEGEE